MTQRTCETCRWWNRHTGVATGDCQRLSPNSLTSKWPATDEADFCGEWQDGKLLPEQHERRELIRQFALAIAQQQTDLKACYPLDVWATARRFADAEGW